MIGKFFELYDKRIFKKIIERCIKNWQKDSPRNIKIPIERSIFLNCEEKDLFFKRIEKNIYDVCFKSPVVTDYEENNTARGFLYLTTHFSAPLVIFIPGWCFRGFRGIDVIHRYLSCGKMNLFLYEPPYHGRRIPEGRYSGDLAITWDTIRTLEGVLQAVLEIKILLSFFKRTGIKFTSIMGVSYGGWIGSLLLTVDNNVDFALLIEPVLRPDKVVWEYPPFRPMVEIWKRKIHDEEYERKLMELFIPSNFSPLIPEEKIKIFSAKYDRISSVEDIKEISQRWNVDYKVYLAGHITLFFNPLLTRDIRSLIRTIV